MLVPKDHNLPLLFLLFCLCSRLIPSLLEMNLAWHTIFAYEKGTRVIKYDGFFYAQYWTVGLGFEVNCRWKMRKVMNFQHTYFHFGQTLWSPILCRAFALFNHASQQFYFKICVLKYMCTVKRRLYYGN